MAGFIAMPGRRALELGMSAEPHECPLHGAGVDPHGTAPDWRFRRGHMLAGMTIRRMDNVGIVVGDLDAAVAFFTEPGMELEGKGQVEGL